MLYRAFATVGGLTLISRLLGFVRDILIAATLGSGAVADAFFVAFRFPNLFRRLFGEGAFNAAFVPLFAKRLAGHHRSDGNQSTGQEPPLAEFAEAPAKGFAGAPAKRFAEESMAVLGAALIVLSTNAILTMPWLMYALAPGFSADPAKYKLAVELSQIAFPYLFCMSIVALLSGVLNALQRYWAAAAAPILLNVVLISALTTSLWNGYGETADAGYILAMAVTAAGIVQLVMLWIAVRQTGLKLAIRWPRYTPDVKRLVELGIPGVISGGITQINIVIGTIIASMQAGAVSFLYYADRLYQLPLGIVGIAIGVVLLPELSRQLTSGDRVKALDTQNRSMEFALLLTLPAAVALGLAATPIISVLFERGAFEASDTAATAQALAAFSIGLPAFVLIKVLQPAFFAREDTKTPMRFAGVNLVVNVIGSLGLFIAFQHLGWMPHVGIALATSIAAWVNTVLLWGALVRNGDFLLDARLARNLPFIILASLAMGAALVFALPYLAHYLEQSQSLLIRIAALGVMVVGGAGIFFLLTALLGVLRPSMLRRAARAPPA
ncbi:MAG: murein biosynthesis integral membrane protein MurJ [Pseudomonadota bacterium]